MGIITHSYGRKFFGVFANQICSVPSRKSLFLRYSLEEVFSDDVTQRMQALARSPPSPPRVELVVYERIVGVCDRMSRMTLGINIYAGGWWEIVFAM